MASLKKKLAITEDLSNAFIDENALTYSKQYQAQLNGIQLTAIDRIGKELPITQKSLRKPFNISGVNRNTRSAFILGAASQLVMHPTSRMLKTQLAPVIKFMKLYSVNNPRQFAMKVDKLVAHALGNKIVLNPREKKALGLLNNYMSDNRDSIQKLVDTNTKALKTINKKITTSESRAIIKKRSQLIKQRVTVNGVKRPLTNKEVAKALKSEFRDDTARLNRILQTEVHRQDELVKEVQALGLGFKFKTWNTQRDSKVRDSHKKLDRKKIRIGRFFNVGGHKASQPGDSTLPPDESINCRCFLTFSN